MPIIDYIVFNTMKPNKDFQAYKLRRLLSNQKRMRKWNKEERHEVKN